MARRSSPSPPVPFHVPGMSVAPLVLSPEVIYEVPHQQSTNSRHLMLCGLMQFSPRLTQREKLGAPARKFFQYAPYSELASISACSHRWLCLLPRPN